MDEQNRGRAGIVPMSIRPGDVLADRYRLDDLLSESGGGRFWRAHDRVLVRPVAIHVLDAADARAEPLLAAARASAALLDRRILRVLDADQRDGITYVVNEWGEGISLDIMLAGEGPLEPRRAAWLTSEVAAAIASAHDAGVAHGRLVPENVLVDHHGSIRLIGLAVDAALHGLPPGRRSGDVADLGAVLYAALTGRWAGVSQSVLPAALTEGEEVLRPRRMRAGVPRPLDDLCDELVNPYATPGAHARTAYDLSTARGITDYLCAFVGDPAGLAAAEARATGGRVPSYPPRDGLPDPQPRLHVPMDPTVAVARSASTSQAPVDAGATQVDATPVEADPQEAPPAERSPVAASHTTMHLPAQEPPAPAEPVAPDEALPLEQPTEAGMPIFDDGTGDVTWMTARASKPPPPPPFELAPERPLFAPAPPPGTPVRTPRPGVATSGQEYWPWARDPGAPTTGSNTGSSTGSFGTGSFGTGSGALLLVEDDDAGVPGRSWLRLAAVIAAAALLLLAVVIGINLGRGRSPLELGSTGSDEPTKVAGGADVGKPVTGLVADDLDPQGDPPEENPDLVGAAVDGDPATAWRTMTYTQNFGPGGLKTGAGLTIDLGQVRDVREVVVTLVGAPTTVSLYLSDVKPTAVKDLTPAATETGDERLTVAFDTPVSGRYLTVWLTSLPAVEGGFRGEIAEVAVRA